MNYLLSRFSILFLAIAMFSSCADAPKSAPAEMSKEAKMKKEAMMKEAEMKKEAMKKEAMMKKEPQKVELSQVPGEFETKSVALKEGAYQFEIANNGVDHKVGFVLVPKGKYTEADHIKAAYVSAPVPDGKRAKSNVVNLKAGEYEYFCPMNPTPKYSLTVGNFETVKLTQIPGAFENKSVSLKAGTYQFEIANNGVDHNVGFVLVPKGKYEPANHIKAAYVTAPVPNGKSSPTSVVSLEAGDYEYFCPLNPTEKYPLTVK